MDFRDWGLVRACGARQVWAGLRLNMSVGHLWVNMGLLMGIPVSVRLTGGHGYRSEYFTPWVLT